MATATTTVTVDKYPSGINNIQRMIKVSGTLAVQAGPATYLTGGLALNWNVLSPDNLAIEVIGGNVSPVDVFFESVGGGLFDYGWNKANNTFQIFAASGGAAQSAPFVELANTTAIPASVSGDTIRFEAWFIRNLG